MLRPDVRWILNDREIGGKQEFIVRRRHIERERGSVREYDEDIKVLGNVQPGSKNAMGDMPEDKLNESIVIRAEFAFQTGSQDVTGMVQADEVIYKGKRYRVNSVENWEEWGFTTANASRVLTG